MKRIYLLLGPILLLTACKSAEVVEVVEPELRPVLVMERAELEDMVILTMPLTNSPVSSPLSVFGTARGLWFFEGSFPVRLEDSDGNILAETPASSSESWMTESFIEFDAMLSFDPGSATAGTLILQRDNPSGLPENDEELRIPVTF